MSKKSENIYVNLKTNEKDTETAVRIGHADRQTDGVTLFAMMNTLTNRCTDTQTVKQTDIQSHPVCIGRHTD